MAFQEVSEQLSSMQMEVMELTLQDLSCGSSPLLV